MKAPKISASELWQAVEEARLASGLVQEECPENAFTAVEYGKQFHISERTARTHLSRMVEDGRMCRGTVSRLDNRGHQYFCSAYWPAAPAEVLPCKFAKTANGPSIRKDSGLTKTRKPSGTY